MLTYTTHRLLIIGLGLIGGSFAKALKSRKVVQHVAAYDRHPQECDLGIRLGVIDEAVQDLASAVQQADVIVLAVPVKAMETVLKDIQPFLRPTTLLTDVGSTKGHLVQAVRQVFQKIPPGFVPGHPIAGAEKSGVVAADADLFERHKVILTPLPESDPKATLEIARLWQSVGAEVLQMDPYRHDQVLAATSHLPHVLAFSLVDTLAHEEENRDIFRYAAGGFRDFTRIAASDPVMWHDICQANRDAILKQIDQFTSGVARLRSAIAAGDSQAMLGIFSRAKVAREHFSTLLAGSAYSANTQDIDLRIEPGSPLSGRVAVHSDRSISHRAIIIGALSEGVTDIEGFFEGEDSLMTIKAFREMGVVIEGPHQGSVRIYGVGLHGLQPPKGPLYLGKSETSLQLLTGLLVAQSFSTEVFGDEALSQQSLLSTLDPLRKMGAKIDSNEQGGPPFRISPSTLKGSEIELTHASAQVKSSLLLAGLYAQGQTCLKTNRFCRDHTERMLKSFGYSLCESEEAGEVRTTIDCAGTLTATKIRVPGDFSTALMLIAAATLVPESSLILTDIGVNPHRTKLLPLLSKMGANIQVTLHKDTGFEPVADIRVTYAQLKGQEFSADDVACVVYELPFLMVLALFAEGQTLIHLPASLSAKESALIASTVAVLLEQGAQIELSGSHLLLKPSLLLGGEISEALPPIVAFAMIVASTRAQQALRIKHSAALLAAYPVLVEQLRRAGISIHKESD